MLTNITPASLLSIIKALHSLIGITRRVNLSKNDKYFLLCEKFTLSLHIVCQ